ncbi:MAG TPA: ABC transporter ATP-binding protein [Actinomycetota bacterium]|nr:ABC transporter ATP-binding protein [Actinomycetota bacterium]
MSTTPARVHLDGVTKRFADVTALEQVDLDVADGEFIALLGPSGCGKTTLLRIVAGFERPTAGRVVLGGDDVTTTPAHRRPVNMVFQRPTLFPHLDVAGNVAFGPRISRLHRDEIRRSVDEALALVRLDGYQHRRSHELSGGQMQRVALARAIVNRPQVLLLDEPLSALDLKIRLEMEVELRRLHREIGGTFIYVTHDQREALALSDRVVVFNEGRIEQVGTPNEVYREPRSPFVARFVGDANVLPVEVRNDGTVTIGEARVPVTASGTAGAAWLVLRPEVVRVEPVDGGDGVRGVVHDVSFRGTGHSYRIAVPGLAEPLKAEVPGVTDHHALGTDVSVRWDPAASRVLPRSGGD